MSGKTRYEEFYVKAGIVVFFLCFQVDVVADSALVSSFDSIGGSGGRSDIKDIKEPHGGTFRYFIRGKSAHASEEDYKVHH